VKERNKKGKNIKKKVEGARPQGRPHAKKTLPEGNGKKSTKEKGEGGVAK